MADQTRVDNFKELAWDMMIDQGIKSMVQANPALGFGPVLIVMTVVIKYFSIYFYQVFKTFIKTEIIVFTNEQNHKQFAGSAVKLQQVAATKGINSTEFMEARNENQKALADFVRYDRARSL